MLRNAKERYGTLWNAMERWGTLGNAEERWGTLNAEERWTVGNGTVTVTEENWKINCIKFKKMFQVCFPNAQTIRDYGK